MFYRSVTAQKFFGIRILCKILLRSFFAGKFSQYYAISIQIDEIRVFGNREGKNIFFFRRNPNIFSGRFSVFINVEHKGKLEITAQLVLTHCNFHFFFHRFEGCGVRNFRVAASEEPLVKKPVQVFTRNFFERQTELMRFARAVFVGFQIIVHSGPKRFVTKIISQHVKNRAAFIVGNRIEHIFFVMVIKSYQIFGNIRRIAEIPFSSLHQSIIGEIFSIFIFIPKIFGIVGERFVNREIAPAFGGYQISKPMVKKFV